MESALYGIYALVVFVSEILLVCCAHSFDFLICQQLVRKKCTLALSMKYSLCILLWLIRDLKIHCCSCVYRYGKITPIHSRQKDWEMGRLLGKKVMSLAHLRNHGCPLSDIPTLPIWSGVSRFDRESPDLMCCLPLSRFLSGSPDLS